MHQLNLAAAQAVLSRGRVDRREELDGAGLARRHAGVGKGWGGAGMQSVGCIQASAFRPLGWIAGSGSASSSALCLLYLCSAIYSGD